MFRFPILNCYAQVTDAADILKLVFVTKVFVTFSNKFPCRDIDVLVISQKRLRTLYYTNGIKEVVS